MAEYEDTGDSKYTRVYKKQTPDILKTWGEFNDQVFSDDRAIPLKYLQLIALGVAFTTQCDYCIDGHVQEAVEAGATEQEIAEAAWVAAAIRAGGAFTHGRTAFKLAARHAAEHHE